MNCYLCRSEEHPYFGLYPGLCCLRSHKESGPDPPLGCVFLMSLTLQPGRGPTIPIWASFPFSLWKWKLRVLSPCVSFLGLETMLRRCCVTVTSLWKSPGSSLILPPAPAPEESHLWHLCFTSSFIGCFCSFVKIQIWSLSESVRSFLPSPFISRFSLTHPS